MWPLQQETAEVSVDPEIRQMRYLQTPLLVHPYTRKGVSDRSAKPHGNKKQLLSKTQENHLLKEMLPDSTNVDNTGTGMG